ncbi:MAG: hypothetical protein HQ517_10625 [SAR324 cluster bacterium]|nr:hypothetical protein [SAR324 cluster bacterium]
MKNLFPILTLLIILLSPDSREIQANPFSCKIEKDTTKIEGETKEKTEVKAKEKGKTEKKAKEKTKEKASIDLVFMGYAIMENQRFAVVQLNNKQHLLQNGESLGAIKIIRFSTNSLYYQVGSTVFNEPINRNVKRSLPDNGSSQEKLYFDK